MPDAQSGLREINADRVRRQNARLATMAGLVLRGYRDPQTLAEHFHISKRQAIRDIKRLDARWLIEELDLTEKRKGRLLAELQLIKREEGDA